MTNCPICGKPVDPLRAPAVSVRDGKIVSYCSKDCAALSESGPAKLIPTKTIRMPTSDERRISGMQAAVAPPGTGIVTTLAPATDSAPAVIEVTREPSRPVVVEPTKPRRKRADSSSFQIADTGHIDDYITPDDPPRRGLAIAVVLLIVAGTAAAAYFLGYLDKLLGRESRGAATALHGRARGDAAVLAPVVPDAAPAITREVALAQAQQLLRTQLKSNSTRVQRVAAAALARTGDAEALEMLAAALSKETGGDIAKAELAYFLARAGDKRGTDALLALADPSKRESKHEAGRRFALLGDVRAIKILESSLRIPQFRLGAAELLAYLAEPRALAVLDAVRADPKALPDEMSRAAIALGWAGRAEIAPALHELLADDRNNSLAAASLAHLHDDKARPVLERQLAIPSLRVQAARGLRRLGSDADVTPLLSTLVAKLASNKDTEQVQIAEAILLLGGPAAWSERE